MKNLVTLFAGLLFVASAAQAQRDQIRIVGSSTVYPFSTLVAEQFGKTSHFKTPVVESTGTGGGFKLFCSGVGTDHPDVSNASRAIKDSEVELCAANGVTAITEIQIGYDGIVVANARSAPRMNLTREQLFRALAKELPTDKGTLIANPSTFWSEIDASLPKVRIEVLGPPPTSGTRDAFVELAMEAGCKSFDWVAALEKTDSKRYKAICHGIREDGVYVEAGENDNLIVQKLSANKDALGIFGFSFLDQNHDKVQGSVIDGVEPTFDNIAGQTYPISRPLFVYIKGAHVGVVPGLKEYVTEYTSEKAMGDEGYLSEAGLIPMPKKERIAVRADAIAFKHNVDK
ncbi:MAG: PstS family phosphate ABC transporter substrate-binding protein [Thermoanaerobaculia bacterium]|nr:PstS family phosphate ABC transporter substrate-binding protein [Thermoanaerobaculia bacterium]